MRNLKKVLCLVLSLAMILSVMVMGTGAVYTDQTSIKNTEAVDVLTSLGVLDGYTDGSFRPNKVVTRAEMAKIITVVLNGGSKATIGSADVSTFSDMETHWALNEVEYCVAKGIIDGYQDGTFRPERTVTGTEAAKMLLTALGYDSTVKGYVGSNWAINVNVDAAQAGIYENLADVDPSQGMARDNIALMVYNMLNANVIEKDVDRYTSSGEIVYKYYEGMTAMQKFFDESRTSRSGILANVYFNKDTKEYTYYFLDASWFDKNGLPESDIFGAYSGQPYVNAAMEDYSWGYTSKTDYSDLFGQNVTAKVNGDGEIYSMVVNKGGVVTEGVWVDVESPDIATSIYTNDFGNTIKIDGQKYRLDNVAKNSTKLKVVGFNEFTNEMYNGLALDPDRVRDQYSFRAIDLDGGGDIDLFVVYPYFVLKTVKCIQDDFFRLDKLDASDGLLVVGDSMLYQDDNLLDYNMYEGLLMQNPNAASIFPGNALAQMGLDPDVEFGEYGDVQVNGNISKDSYVQAIPAKYTVEGEDIYNVLEVKTDVATSMKSADFRITLGGTLMDGTLLYSPIVKFDDLSVGETYSYVEINTFLFLIDTEADEVGPDDYVVVVDSALENHFGPTTTGTVAKVYEAELLFSDGSTKVVNISDDTYDDAWTGWLYSYEVDKHGNYELTAVDSPYAPRGDFNTYLPYEYGAPLPFYNARNSLSFNQLRQNLRTNGWYDQDKAGGYFESLSGDIYRIAPDAVVFAYDYVNDGYTVLKGSDLEKYENSNWHSWDIEVAFIGANDFVELAYVCVPMALGEGYTTVYAYIDSETIRTAENADASGNHYVTFSAITEPNVVTTFETKHEEDEGTPLQRFVYDLDDGDFVKLTLNPDGQVVFMTYVWGDYGIVEKVSDKVTKNAFELTVDFFTAVDTGIVDKDNTVVIFTDGSGRTDKTEITEDDVVFVDYRWFDWRNDNDFTVVYVLSESDYRLDTDW